MSHDEGVSDVITEGRPRSNPGRGKRPIGAIGHPITRRLDRSVMDRAMFDYLSALGSPVALSVWLLYEAGDMRQLVEKSIDPHDYNEVDQWQRDYAAVKLLSKCAGLNTGINVDEVAIDSALAAEVQCRDTNHEIRRRRRGETPDFYAPEFFRAKSLIARILGKAPSDLSRLDPGFSQGRTTSASGLNLTAFEKYKSRLDVTMSARKYATPFLRDCPNWGAAALDADGPCSILSSGLNTVSGNVMLVVPKNAKTGRVICYEPHVNIRLQLSVGGLIRRCLLRAGVDLSDQSINQRRATFGSRTGLLATLDLRSASDTIALELVWELLPYDWAALLDDLRSKYTTWPDGTVKFNEKFSSMGNGFTFELESLIFYALAKACTTDVTVYGDDIIIPTNKYEYVTNVLKYAGFFLNERKSFATSEFRESCGEDAFRGVRSTPVYLRNPIRVLGDLIKFHNNVRVLAHQSSYQVAVRLVGLMAVWRQAFPHFHGPQGYGDGHYHVNLDVGTPRADFQLDGWWFKTTERYYPFHSFDGNDRVEGNFSPRESYAALCVATGPKRARSLWDTLSDRRQVRYRTVRVLANFDWPELTLSP